jgi:glycosyltransferase involved in cell wall biosynthesis
MMADRSVLLDARWIGIGGPGRVAEHLLQGLQAIDPPGRFIVWGPDAVDAHLWRTARRIPNRRHPKSWYSQREFPGPRGADAAFFAHHLRPAWRLAPVEVTTVHDTIPFRYPPNRSLAPAMRAYITWMARRATLVTTDSQFSKSCIVEDCRVAPERVAVLNLPIDHASTARIRQLRATASIEARAMFIGRDAPHKNLDRLVRAFATTEFASGGATLTLVGVDGAAVSRLHAIAAGRGARIQLPGVVSQEQLESLLASCAMLVQPSLEEGFGLPVAEAMAGGVPVAVSSGGALPEILRGAPVEMFDPLDEDAIAASIDRVARSPSTSELEWPGPEDFARSVLSAIDQAFALAR